jgi:hypothetical protein
MRNCSGCMRSFFSSNWRKFSSSCLSCLSCFGSPQNNSKQEDQEGIEQNPASNTASNPASNVLAEVVFVSPVPKFNQAVDAGNDALDIQKSEAIQSSDPKNLKSQTQTSDAQTQTSDAQTQTSEIEISEQETIDPENTASTEQDINDNKDRQIKALTELRHFQEIRIAELVNSLRNLEARLDLLEDSKREPMREPEPEKENKTQETNSTPPTSSQELPAFGVLQDSSSSQIYYSASEERDINSSPQWGGEGYKMLSPLISQGPSTIEGLQDFSDPIPFNHVDDSVLNNSQSSSNSQSSTGTLTQSTETNISYFPKDDKTKERNLILLEKASTDAVSGASEFSKAMDAITKDLKEAINDPSYPTKSIAIDPPSPSSSPSSTLRSPAPRVLDVRVVGNVDQLVVY